MHASLRAAKHENDSSGTHQLKGVSRVVLAVEADDLADHGVLAHEHGRGAAESVTDLGHLVRSDIVGLCEGKADEYGWCGVVWCVCGGVGRVRGVRRRVVRPKTPPISRRR